VSIYNGFFSLVERRVFRENDSPIDKLPTSLQIATSMETVIEKNILQQAGTVRGECVPSSSNKAKNGEASIEGSLCCALREYSPTKDWLSLSSIFSNNCPF
jgi:hypothetical protein